MVLCFSFTGKKSPIKIISILKNILFPLLSQKNTSACNKAFLPVYFLKYLRKQSVAPAELSRRAQSHQRHLLPAQMCIPRRAFIGELLFNKKCRHFPANKKSPLRDKGHTRKKICLLPNCVCVLYKNLSVFLQILYAEHPPVPAGDYSIPTYVLFWITTAFGDLLTSPVSFQVSPSSPPVSP